MVSEMIVTDYNLVVDLQFYIVPYTDVSHNNYVSSLSKCYVFIFAHPHWRLFT